MTNLIEPKICIGQFNFTNCLPINYSFHKWALERIIISEGYPSLINQLIYDNQVYIAPISSIEYLKNQDRYTLMESACITTEDEVGSVILFSKYNFNELEGKKIALPYTSVTSIALLKILFKEANINLESVTFFNHKYENNLNTALSKSCDAILYIGDPALVANYKCNSNIKKYDLGSLWKELTGYPMVFATWVARSDWKNNNEDDFEWVNYLLDKAVEAGLSMYFNEVVNLASENLSLDKACIEDYLTNKIRYNLTYRHKESLRLFGEKYSEICQTDKISVS